MSRLYPRQLASYRGNLARDLEDFQQRNRRVDQLAESLSSRLMRNYVYKPLLHCRLV